MYLTRVLLRTGLWLKHTQLLRDLPKCCSYPTENALKFAPLTTESSAWRLIHGACLCLWRCHMKSEQELQVDAQLHQPLKHPVNKIPPCCLQIVTSKPPTSSSVVKVLQCVCL